MRLFSVVLGCFLVLTYGPYLLVQNGDGGIGRAALPCLCLLNPEFGSGISAAPILLAAFIMAVIFCVVEYFGKKKDDTEAADIACFLHKRVTFSRDDGDKQVTCDGVIVHQEGKKIYINWLNDYGNIVQSVRTVDQVVVKE